MRFGIIGAGGHLGSKLAREALDRGHQVTAIIRSTPCADPRALELKRDLFDLTREDICQFDVLLSAYGSGFEADPVINRQAIEHLADIAAGTGVHLVMIGGAGCLYADETETTLAYELPTHPPFLKGISKNISEGYEKLRQRRDVRWTFVCPSVMLDFNGPRTGDYLTRSDRHILTNDDGGSYVSGDDLAVAMVDFGERSSFVGQLVTVASRKGTPKW